MDSGSVSILRVVDIIEGTAVDGPGLRTSIYLAGCLHQCPGCHNPETWPMNAGHDMSLEEILEIINKNDFNVSFSGGDPIYQIVPLLNLIKGIKKSNRSIWVYTGFKFEELVKNTLYTELIKSIDVLVDGPFIEEEKDMSLLFRGSRNQRLIDCRLSTENNIVLWQM